MTQHSSSDTSIEWSFLAVELKHILEARGLTLWSLQERVKIHKEHVRRLINSLATNKHFALLSPDQIRAIEQALQLTPTERNRVMAALLTTHMEILLVNRMPVELAFQAATRIFPVLLEMVELDAHRQGILSYLESAPTMENTTLIDVALAPVYLFFDRANIALFASQHTTSFLEAVASMEQAIAELEHAQAQFAEISVQVVSSEIGQFWQQEVREWLQAAQQQLRTLKTPEE